MNNFGDKVSFIWSVADLPRGPHGRITVKRPLKEIEADLKKIEREIAEILGEVT